MIKIGHRGAMGYEPENTLRSFQKAIELGVDMIELDVYVLKTGELIVFHDDKVDRTTNGKGYLGDKTFEEIRQLDAGKGEQIPTLSEVLDLVNRKVMVNIELKGTSTAEPVSHLVRDYIQNKGWNENDFVISSFDHHELHLFKTLNPKIKIGVLISCIPLGFARIAKDINAEFINPCLEFINAALVKNAHKQGIKVLVYTVNDPDDIDRMKALGVDGIFSNFPDRL